MSDERTLIFNGRFLHNLGNWTATGATYSAGDGDDHYGVALLASAGHKIAQTFAVDRVRSYTLHTSIKCSSAITSGQVTAVITDGNGNTVATLNLTAGTPDTWTEAENVLGLAPGSTYTLTITNVGAAAAVKVDDVWLWAVPATRAQLAAKVNTKLARLASERSLSTTPSGSNTEGDYTNAVDAGLRSVGALDPETDAADVRWLEGTTLDLALDAIEQEMLEQLYRDYSVETDISVGPRSEQRSQIAGAVREILKPSGGGGGSRRVQMRPLTHEGFDE